VGWGKVRQGLLRSGTGFMARFGYVRCGGAN